MEPKFATPGLIFALRHVRGALCEGSIVAAIAAGAGTHPGSTSPSVAEADLCRAGRDTRILSFPRGPAPGSRLSPDFVREIGRFAYLWAWPLVNVFNRYTSFQRIKTQTLLIGGVAPVAPINWLAMLHDYISPRQRYITCPAQDLVYGFGILDLEREPVVVQVPDFGQRYWVYQATDLRTDGFAELGAMYGTKPGFYPARRPRLERSQAGQHRRRVHQLDQYRHHRPARFPARRQGRQRGTPAGAAADRGLSAV